MRSPASILAVLVALAGMAWPPSVARAEVTGMKIIAHRGVLREAPQNTLPALRKAIELGLDYCELDLQTTKDGRIVDMHDHEIDGTTNGHGFIKDYTCAEIRALDAGSWFGPQFKGEKVPLFAEELALARGRIKLYLDMKSADSLHVLRLLQEFGMVKDALYLGGQETARIADPSLPLLSHLNHAEDMADIAAREHPQYVARVAGPLDPGAVAAAHRYGAKYYLDIQGVNDNEEYIMACLRAGVDGVQTNNPRLVMEVLRKAGFVRPAPRPAPELPPVRGVRRDSGRVKVIARASSPLDTRTAVRSAIVSGVDYLRLKVSVGPDNMLYAAAPGSRTPLLLGEALALAKGRVGVCLELGRPGLMRVVLLIQDFDMAREVLVTGDVGTCRQVRAMDAEIALMPAARRLDQIRRMHRLLHPQAVELQGDSMTPEGVGACHELGMLAFADVRKADDGVARAIAAGADGLDTDRPQATLTALQSTSQ